MEARRTARRGRLVCLAVGLLLSSAPLGAESVNPRPKGVEDSAYEGFAQPKEYPDDGPRTVVTSPFAPLASPFGWHDTDGVAGAEFTITRGNNVHGYADRDGDQMPDTGSFAEPDGGASLDFTGLVVPLDLDLEPVESVQASIANIFYWNNVIHDILYVHGFDEAAGNFQANNYGNGGQGGDDIRAEVQNSADQGATNGANFSIPPDGGRPVMQQFEWTFTSPRRDGALSSFAIIDMYGLGVAKRLTGGPDTVSCLANDEAMTMGWADWLALVLTATAIDTATTTRGVGTYLFGMPPDSDGAREAPYTTDFAANDFTYGDLPGLAVPHGVGFLWATMLWEVYWNLVEAEGFSPDLHDDWSTAGNNLALRLVIDGLKLQPCIPGFVDGRDAVLLADLALTGGANQCPLWTAFAARGLGAGASQGSSQSLVDGVEAFDLPADCGTIFADGFESGDTQAWSLAVP